MKEVIKHRLRVALGLLLLGTLVAGAVWIMLRLIGILESVDPNVAAAIIAGVVTISVSVFSVIYTRRRESKIATENEHRQKKSPIYEKLINFMGLALLGEKVGKKPTEKEILEFLLRFNHELMTWGSDEILRRFIDFRRKLIFAAGTESIDVIFYYEDLVYAIRRDLGHQNTDLKRGDILSLFINDIDQYL